MASTRAVSACRPGYAARLVSWLAIPLITGCNTVIDAAADLPDSEVAIVRGYERYYVFYNRWLNITRVDDEVQPGFPGHSDAARVAPGRHLFLVEEVFASLGESSQLCFFELETEAGHTYRLRPGSGSTQPNRVVAFAGTIDADVEVDGEVATAVRIPVECLRPASSCRSDADCVTVGIDRELACTKSRPNRASGICDIEDGPWIPQIEASSVESVMLEFGGGQ